MSAPVRGACIVVDRALEAATSPMAMPVFFTTALPSCVMRLPTSTPNLDSPLTASCPTLVPILPTVRVTAPDTPLITPSSLPIKKSTANGALCPPICPQAYPLPTLRSFCAAAMSAPYDCWASSCEALVLSPSSSFTLARSLATASYVSVKPQFQFEMSKALSLKPRHKPPRNVPFWSSLAALMSLIRSSAALRAARSIQYSSLPIDTSFISSSMRFISSVALSRPRASFCACSSARLRFSASTASSMPLL